MTDRQTRKYNAGKSAMQVMNDSANTPIWSGSTAVKNRKVAIETNLTNIEHFGQLQSTDNTGITAGKRKLKSDGANKAWGIAKPTAAYARDTNNSTLLSQVDYELSDLLFVKDADAENRWQIIIDAATANLTALKTGGYGVDQPIIDAAQLAKDSFVGSVGSPEQARADKKESTADLAAEEKKMDDSEIALKELLVQYSTTQPDFYNAVLDAFAQVDTGVRHIAMRFVMSDDTTGTRIVNANVNVPELNIDRKTSDRGIVDFSQLEAKEGNYSAKITATGYTDVNLSNLAVFADKFLKVAVKMKKV